MRLESRNSWLYHLLFLSSTLCFENATENSIYLFLRHSRHVVPYFNHLLPNTVSRFNLIAVQLFTLSNNFPTCFATIYGFRFIVLPLNNYPLYLYEATSGFRILSLSLNLCLYPFAHISMFEGTLFRLFVCGYIRDPSLCLNLFLSVFLSNIR
jgi:hypothetical protein